MSKKNIKTPQDTAAEKKEEKFAALVKEHESLKKVSEGKIADLQGEIAELEKKYKSLKTQSEGKIATLEKEKETLEKSIQKAAPKKVLSMDEYLKTRETINIDGITYGFIYGTPENLTIDGAAFATKDLIKDKTAMKDLVYGGAIFIEIVNSN